MTELHLAAAYGGPEICTRILEGGASVDLFEAEYGTPLCAASAVGNARNVELLITSGANVEAEDKEGSTAIFYAAAFGRLDVIHCLLDHGANIEHENQRGCTVLNEVSASESTASAEALLERNANANHLSADGSTPLHNAVKGQNPNMIRLLLKHGARVGMEGPHGWSPLHAAVASGNLSTIELLCAEGAQIDALDDLRFSPLFHAVLNNNLDAARLLLDKDARTSICGRTVFRVAAYKGLSSLLRLILEHIQRHMAANLAEINHADQDGNCPLHIAAMEGDLESAIALTEAVAEIDVEDRISRTPLYFAKTRGKKDVEHYILSRGAKPALPSTHKATVEFEDGNTIRMNLNIGLSEEVQMTDEDIVRLLFQALENEEGLPSPIVEIRLD